MVPYTDYAIVAVQKAANISRAKGVNTETGFLVEDWISNNIISQYKDERGETSKKGCDYFIAASISGDLDGFELTQVAS